MNAENLGEQDNFAHELQNELFPRTITFPYAFNGPVFFGEGDRIRKPHEYTLLYQHLINGNLPQPTAFGNAIISGCYVSRETPIQFRGEVISFGNPRKFWPRQTPILSLEYRVIGKRLCPQVLHLLSQGYSVFGGLDTPNLEWVIEGDNYYPRGNNYNGRTIQGNHEILTFLPDLKKRFALQTRFLREENYLAAFITTLLALYKGEKVAWVNPNILYPEKVLMADALNMAFASGGRLVSWSTSGVALDKLNPDVVFVDSSTGIKDRVKIDPLNTKLTSDMRELVYYIRDLSPEPPQS